MPLSEYCTLSISEHLWCFSSYDLYLSDKHQCTELCDVSNKSLGHCVKEPVLRCDAVGLERPHLSGQHRLGSSAKCADSWRIRKNENVDSHFCSVYVRTNFQGFPLSTSWQLLSSPQIIQTRFIAPKLNYLLPSYKPYFHLVP